jgi:molybdopterin converting factor small subunit
MELRGVQASVGRGIIHRSNQEPDQSDYLTMSILLFAHLRDVVGRSEFDLQVVGPLKGSELWDRLIAEFPVLSGHRGSTRLARNGAYATDEDYFDEDDEVALIPPVSGG